jgi:ABC-type transport system involved in cytochrome c biogenesis permease subunit
LSFSLLALLVISLVCATCAEQIYGSEFAHRYLYASPLSIAAWAFTVFPGLAWIIRRRVGAFTFSLHVSLAVILAGALASHLTARQGILHLRIGEKPTRAYVCDDGNGEDMPFCVSLKAFRQEFYSGTSAPMDFVSTIDIDGMEGDISMNNVLSHDGYRFYQSGYDDDMLGSTVMVSYDPYGIGVTYAGYTLLLVSMIGFLFQRKSRWRDALSEVSKYKLTVFLFVMLLIPAYAGAAVGGKPRTAPREVADKFGDIYIYYNDRVCPLETFAHDFTLKVYGSTSYHGLTAVQVLTGWLLYYDEWKCEPFIKIKDSDVRGMLDADGKYVTLRQFVSASGYKLDGAMNGGKAKAVAAANEKFNLVSTVATGSALRIYPVLPGDSASVEWFSPVDRLPVSTPDEVWVFIRKSLNLLAQYVYDGDTMKAVDMLSSMKRYQQRSVAGHMLPDERHFAAEKFYNRMPPMRYVGMVVLIVGLFCYIFLILMLTSGFKPLHSDVVMRLFLSVLLLYLTLSVALRWYISGHAPLTNGFETMQFMGWCCAFISLPLSRKWGVVSLSSGIMVCGFALLVAGFGEGNPQITQLMPVLASPLLSVHVALIMFAYTLLAICMLNGLASIVVWMARGAVSGSVVMLHTVSRVLLTPALFMLAAGIFIGAVWANQSWGTYWSWDPKETWALITFIIYAFALHDISLPVFRSPIFFHFYMLIAFLSVLMTYFGVNYLLGGMHSYAA